MRCPLISLRQERERSGSGGDLFSQPVLTEFIDQGAASKGQKGQASQGSGPVPVRDTLQRKGWARGVMEDIQRGPCTPIRLDQSQGGRESFVSKASLELPPP